MEVLIVILAVAGAALTIAAFALLMAHIVDDIL